MKLLVAALMVVLPMAAVHAESGADALFRKTYIESCLFRTAVIAEYRARINALEYALATKQDNIRMIMYLEDEAGTKAHTSSYDLCVNTTRPLEEMKFIYENVKEESKKVLVAYDNLKLKIYPNRR